MDILGNHLLTRARFYDALAAAIDAGLPIDQAIVTGAPGGRVGNLAASALVSEVTAGRTFAEALKKHLAPCTSSEMAIIEAGELSGHLPGALRRLGKYFADIAAHRRQLFWKLAYPVGLVHAAILLPTLPVLVRSGVNSYLATAGTAFLGLYAVVFAIWIFLQTPLAARLLPAVPVVRTWLQSRAVADYAFVLASFLEAGTALPESLRAAATSTDLPSFRAAGLRVALAIGGGATLGDAFSADQAVFGTALVEQIKIGETTGTLDDMMSKAETFARYEADQAMKLLTVGLSALAFVVAALVVGWVVLDFWSGYADMINITKLHLF